MHILIWFKLLEEVRGELEKRVSAAVYKTWVEAAVVSASAVGELVKAYGVRIKLPPHRWIFLQFSKYIY